MTVEDMMTEIWESIGEPSDIDPTDSSGSIDSSTDGFARILKWINRGYNRIWNWRFRDGTLLRFSAQYATKNFQGVVYSGTAVSGSAAGIVLPSGTYQSSDDYYNDWLIYLHSGTGSGQTRYVADYAGSSRNVIPAEDFSTAPDSDTQFSLYKRHMKFLVAGATGVTDNIDLDPKEDLFTVLKVVDLVDEQELAEGLRTDSYAGSRTEYGTPSTYYVYGDTLYFDIALDEGRWYQLEYLKQPSELTSTGDSPDIPSIWHEGILLYAVWWGQRLQEDFTNAYATKRDLIDFMETTKQSGEMQYERTLGSLEVIDPVNY